MQVVKLVAELLDLGTEAGSPLAQSFAEPWQTFGRQFHAASLNPDFEKPRIDNSARGTSLGLEHAIACISLQRDVPECLKAASNRKRTSKIQKGHVLLHCLHPMCTSQKMLTMQTRDTLITLDAQYPVSTLRLMAHQGASWYLPRKPFLNLHKFPARFL